MSKKKYYDLVLSCFDEDGNREDAHLLVGGCPLWSARNCAYDEVKNLEAGKYNDLICYYETVAIEIEEHLDSDGSLVLIHEIPQEICRTYKVSDLLGPDASDLHIYDIVVTQTTTVTGVEAVSRDAALKMAQENAWSHAADSIDAMVVSEDGDPSKGDIAEHIMISLKEVLSLIPHDDIAGPKPSKLRKDILALAGLSDWAE